MLTKLRGYMALAKHLRGEPTSGKENQTMSDAFPSALARRIATDRIYRFQDLLHRFKLSFKDLLLTILLGIVIGAPALATVIWA